MQLYQTLILQEDLKYPEQYHDDVVKYTQTKHSKEEVSLNRQENPFQRYIDLWFLAVCIGARSHVQNEVLPTEEMHKFHDGSILTRDPWRIDMLTVMAIGYSSDPLIIEKPKAVINLANSFTISGIPILLDMLTDKIELPNFSTPIWKLSRRVNILLSEFSGKS